MAAVAVVMLWWWWWWWRALLTAFRLTHAHPAPRGVARAVPHAALQPLQCCQGCALVQQEGGRAHSRAVHRPTERCAVLCCAAASQPTHSVCTHASASASAHMRLCQRQRTRVCVSVCAHVCAPPQEASSTARALPTSSSWSSCCQRRALRPDGAAGCWPDNSWPVS